jgi:hypothetical protein
LAGLGEPDLAPSSSSNRGFGHRLRLHRGIIPFGRRRDGPGRAAIRDDGRVDHGPQLTSGPKDRRPAPVVLLAMAMFVLVVDTSLMNVSIAKVVEDLDTTVSGVQGPSRSRRWCRRRSS